MSDTTNNLKFMSKNSKFIAKNVLTKNSKFIAKNVLTKNSKFIAKNVLTKNDLSEVLKNMANDLVASEVGIVTKKNS
jgi:cytochrome c-type biogenesis protein CcmE